jgi:hypothetical protein
MKRRKGAMIKDRRENRLARKIARIVAAGLLVLPLVSCGLDEVKMPQMDGPSTNALQLILTANPDVLIADGVSTSSIGVYLRGPDGNGIASRQIRMSIADPSGYWAEIGTLSQDIVTTDQNGAANLIYTSPNRHDHSGDGFVMIAARPLSLDAQGEFYRNIEIELRAAEGGRIPAGGKELTATFIVEPAVGPYAVGDVISFQSTSKTAEGNFIIRTEWDFGDGIRDDGRDTAHVYRWADDFTVTHVVTDNVGNQASEQRTLNVQ